MCKTNLMNQLQQLDYEEANLIMEIEACHPEYDAVERFSLQMQLEILLQEKEALLIKLGY